jgi:hypothetical protein
VIDVGYFATSLVWMRRSLDLVTGVCEILSKVHIANALRRETASVRTMLGLGCLVLLSYCDNAHLEQIAPDLHRESREAISFAGI